MRNLRSDARRNTKYGVAGFRQMVDVLVGCLQQAGPLVALSNGEVQARSRALWEPAEVVVALLGREGQEVDCRVLSGNATCGDGVEAAKLQQHLVLRLVAVESVGCGGPAGVPERSRRELKQKVVKNWPEFAPRHDAHT
eukprot:6192708-Pleurochrysis_carterae.AAC.4